MKIKRGDNVKVIAGDDKGVTGVCMYAPMRRRASS